MYFIFYTEHKDFVNFWKTVPLNMKITFLNKWKPYSVPTFKMAYTRTTPWIILVLENILNLVIFAYIYIIIYDIIS